MLRKLVQWVDEILPDFECGFVEKQLISDSKIKINAGQAEELRLFSDAFFYLHDSSIAVTKDGVYVIATGYGEEHFATSWQKIWFNGLKFDDGAIAVLNNKQLFLQAYVLRCLKRWKSENPMRILMVGGYHCLYYCDHEIEIEGCSRICQMPFINVCKMKQYLFANTAQEDAFWDQFNEE